MITRIGWLAAMLALLGPANIAAQVLGVVVDPFHTDSLIYGETGQLVTYVERGLRLELRLPQDTVEVRRSEGDIVPFDSVFTPAYILAAFRACEPYCRSSFSRGRTQMGTKQERLHLIQRTLELFPDHPDVADFRAIECTMLVPLDSKLRGTDAIECADRFVADYAAHLRADELAWLAVRLRNAVYEFEGDTDAMRRQAEAFAAYAETHPRSRMADEARMRVARLYYMIQEVSGEPVESEYRQLAEELYDSLARSSNESIRLRAIIQRFNLMHGRRIYISPNAWSVR